MENNMYQIDNISECQRIYEHPLYQKELERIRKFEVDRIFCNHGFDHFMDVARIAYILNLEHNLGISRNIIYAAAILHDIGRAKQYDEGIPHEEAGADLVGIILADCGYSDSDIAVIVDAIRNHRSNHVDNTQNTLGDILYIADKTARQCFDCTAQKECNWSMEKRNMEVYI